MNPKQQSCPHMNFAAQVDVARILDGDDGPVRRYNAEVTIKCADCDRQFRFLGLPMGLDMNGAAVNPNGTEARLAIYPVGETPPDFRDDEPAGFRILHERPKL